MDKRFHTLIETYAEGLGCPLGRVEGGGGPHVNTSCEDCSDREKG